MAQWLSVVTKKKKQLELSKPLTEGAIYTLGVDTLEPIHVWFGHDTYLGVTVEGRKTFVATAEMASAKFILITSKPLLLLDNLHIQLKLGEDVTDWTPAPEDIIIGDLDKNRYTINLDQLNHIIELGVQDLLKAENNVREQWFVSKYREIIAVILTDVQIVEQALQEEKRKAHIVINSYFVEEKYNAEGVLELRGLVSSGRNRIEQATAIQEVKTTIDWFVDSVESITQKKHKDKRMYLNTSTHDFDSISRGRDPDLFEGESDYRLIQLYHNHFAGLTFPGTSKPQPSLKLFTMSKEEVE